MVDADDDGCVPTFLSGCCWFKSKVDEPVIEEGLVVVVVVVAEAATVTDGGGGI